MVSTVLRRAATRLAITAALIAASAVTLLAGPAWACGCGVYSPARGGTAAVPRETALVVAPAAAGGREDIYLSLSVDSDVSSGALLFPVPDRRASVAAGPTDLFDDLSGLTTAPNEDTGAGGSGKYGAPAQPGVTVEHRQQVGPLDVVTLSSGSAAALTRWLPANGFAAKPALTTAAEPYIRLGWAFVAVRLRPDASGVPLDGRLDPLRISFASPELIYPMRLSALATEPEAVTVYTLAAHRLSLHTRTPGMSVSWAGPVLRTGAFPSLGQVTHGGTFLTRFDGFLTPATITDDFHFGPSGSDATAGYQGHARFVDAPDLPPVRGHGHTTRTVLLAAGGGVGGLVVILALVHRARRRS